MLYLLCIGVHIVITFYNNVKLYAYILNGKFTVYLTCVRLIIYLV